MRAHGEACARAAARTRTSRHAFLSGVSVWRNVWRGRAALAVLLALGILSGCATTSASNEQPQHVLAVGSTALQPLVTPAAQLYQQLHPQTRVEVQGGGSKSGLAAVTAHKSDIGDSDIYADPTEYPDPDLTDHLVCAVPFAMIVNPDVTVPSLTTDQIIAIFSTGTITNWKAVGGPDVPVVPVVRPATSGTRATFRKYVLGGRDENGKLLTTDSSETVRDTVANTPGAIGYVGVAYLTASVRVMAIGGQLPTPENISAGRYAFWGFEHMYTIGDDTGAVGAFLDFMLTPQIQRLAQQLGYIPIAQMKLAGTGGRPVGEVSHEAA
jgi:phosphate transport system substrate-binding protein